MPNAKQMQMRPKNEFSPNGIDQTVESSTCALCTVEMSATTAEGQSNYDLNKNTMNFHDANLN